MTPKANTIHYDHQTGKITLDGVPLLLSEAGLKVDGLYSHGTPNVTLTLLCPNILIEGAGN